MRRLGCGFAIATPAFPTNGRTVFQGHLFVGDALLNESGMQNHPLTPMSDANLVRVLGAADRRARVGLVPFATVEQGAAAIRRAMTALKESGRRYAIVDAVTDAHLLAIGEAAAGHALITGGSGVAMGLPGELPPRGLLPERGDAAAACRRWRGTRRCWPAPARAPRSGRSAWRGTTCRSWSWTRSPRRMRRR